MSDDTLRKRSTVELVSLLTDRLQTSPSATAILEDWCREYGFSAEPILLALPVVASRKAPTPIQCGRLAVGDPTVVRYRRVRLTCGGLVLSEAENWYVPGRLTGAMNRILDTTTTPFGRVVHPLAPSRRNLSLDVLWTPEAGEPRPETPLFAIHAVLSTGDGTPFCEVTETYHGAVLIKAG
jgi:chorismate-pyruvate lyase